MQEVLGTTEHPEHPKVENLELESIFMELDEDYKQGTLDAFLLYL
jgi:hypothetical protein